MNCMSSIPTCLTFSKNEIVQDSKQLDAEDIISFRVCQDVNQLTVDWEKTRPLDDSFLSIAYLKILEPLRDKGFSFYYVIYYKGDKPIGLAYFQSIPFRFTRAQNQHGSKLNQWLVYPILDLFLKLRILVCGSVFLTGEHGLYFEPNSVPWGEQQNWVLRAAKHIKKIESKAIKILLIKDQKMNSSKALDFYKNLNFIGITMQPAMALEHPDRWRNMDDYLKAMSSKYRVRVRRARKKSKEIKQRELNSDQVQAYATQLDRLYLEVANQAEFNAANLPENYFLQMKRSFPDQFRIFTYYLKEQLIGFCTTFLNGPVLEAHFLGFYQQYNHQYQLYLNMLYDMVEVGIESKVSRINFARTALEIKSSVGAVPEFYYTHFQHTDRFLHRITQKIVQRLEPEVKWVQRNPFKQQE